MTALGRLTYTTQEVQDRLDSVGQMVRPNLLDNAYFIGGGSQSGSGKFPINQRGQTTYSHPGSYLSYSIDRWIFRDNSNTGHNVQLTANGLQMNYTGTAIGGFTQAIENKEDLLGKTVTISALMENMSGVQCRFGIFLSSVAGAHTSALVTADGLANGLISATVTLPSTTTYQYMMVGFFTDTNKGFTGLCKAVKMEIGSTQTLAHWDEATQAWVLNEKPNYQQELARCQRFFYRFDYHGINYGTMFGKATSTTSARVTLPLPVRMRTNPAISSKGQIRIEYNGTNALSSDYTVYATSDEGVVFAIASLSSGSLPGDGYPVYAFFNTETDTDLSADL